MTEESTDLTLLAEDLSNSESSIELFFNELDFDSASITLVSSITKVINGNEDLFASYLLTWLERSVEHINNSNSQLKEKVLELILLVLGAKELGEEWVSVHQNSWRLIYSIDKELAIQVLTNVTIGIPRRWLFEPRLTQLLLWLWKHWIQELPSEFSLRLLKLSLMACTKSRPTDSLFATPVILPAFLLNTDLSWRELTEAYGEDEDAIVPFLIQNQPKEVFSILKNTLDVAVYLERIEFSDAPPTSRTVISRRSIEESSQTRDDFNDYVSHLLVFIRDTLIALHQVTPDYWCDAIRKLAHGEWYCHHRLAMSALGSVDDDESLRMVMEFLPTWISEHTSLESGAAAEYHHELWKLLNSRSLDIAQGGKAGRDMIRSIVLSLEDYFKSLKLHLDGSKYPVPMSMEAYVGHHMRIWLGAMEPALELEGFEELKTRLEYYRSRKAEFGEDKPSDLFSYYSQGGRVREVPLCGVDDFLTRIENLGADSAIEYLIDNPPSRALDEYKEGEVISHNLSPMLKKLAVENPSLTSILLKHDEILNISIDYISALAYGLDDLAGLIKKGEGKKSLLSSLLDALESALNLRLKMTKLRDSRSSNSELLHGAYMALADVADVSVKPTHMMKVVKLSRTAYDPEMFVSSSLKRQTTGSDRGDIEFDRLEVIAESQYPIMALIEIARKTYNLDVRKQGDLSKSEKRLSELTIQTLKCVLKSAPTHPASRQIGRYLGQDFHMLLLYGERFDSELHEQAKQVFAQTATDTASAFGTSVRYGHLQRGRVHGTSLDIYIPFYNYCIAEFGEVESNKAYSELLGWHLFVLFYRSQGGVKGSENDILSNKTNANDIDKLVLRVFKQRTEVYDKLKAAVLASPCKLQNEISSTTWRKVLLPLRSLAIEGAGSSSKAYTALMRWGECLPDNLSLTRTIANQASPLAIIIQGIQSTDSSTFDGHQAGYLVKGIVERGLSKPRELMSVCEITKCVLLLCRRVRQSDKSTYLPYWNLADIWKLINKARTRRRPMSRDLEVLIDELENLLVHLKVNQTG